MTIARNHQLFLAEPTYFHLISRCVRRAFLCGKDKYTGKRFDHRKHWLEKRLFELSEEFFIDLYGYAIMSNHYHLIVQTRPDEMIMASDEQIATRWCHLFPRRNESKALRIKSLCQDKTKINIYRLRLCDISWLMRCLNEGLARNANKEDGCTGRFWQGRFRSQLLLDESAVYTCMAYVDLNPVRAGMARTPEKSEFTSFHYRITHHCVKDKIRPLNNNHNQLNLILSDYLDLVDEAGRCIRDDKFDYIPKKVHPILAGLNIKQPGFIKVLLGMNSLFSRAVGHPDRLDNLSDILQLRWMKGQSMARRVFG